MRWAALVPNDCRDVMTCTVELFLKALWWLSQCISHLYASSLLSISACEVARLWKSV